MSGQAQDAVVLHVPARNNDVAAAGRNFCGNGFIAELGQKPLEGFHIFRDDCYFRIGGVGRRMRDFHPEGARNIAVRRIEFQ